MIFDFSGEIIFKRRFSMTQDFEGAGIIIFIWGRERVARRLLRYLFPAELMDLGWLQCCTDKRFISRQQDPKRLTRGAMTEWRVWIGNIRLPGKLVS
jgi:hypothetical protein